MPINSRPHLTTITPLRGIAALFVVIHHCNVMYRYYLPSTYTHFVENGWLWVDFFFVLSGFIMCYAYSKYFASGVGKSNFRKYIGARFARIYPLNFITAIWAFIVSAIIVYLSPKLDPFMAQIFNPKALPACLLLVQSMHVGYTTAPLNTPSWSLSTEWWAYLIFPFFLPLFIRLKARGKIVGLLLIVAAFIVLRYVLGPISYDSEGPTINMLTDFGFLRCLAGFFAGMLLFTFYEHRSGENILKHDWFFTIISLGALAAMHFGLMDIVIVAFFPLIILSAAYNQTTVKRILDTRVLQRLGDWSFTIYMVHVPIILTFNMIDVMKDHAYFADLGKLATEKPNYVLNAVMCLPIFALTLIVAGLVYRFVEVPARNYFNGLFNTKRPRVVPEEIAK